MPQAMPLPTRIRQGASKTRKQKIWSADFGDGYSQRIAKGLNSIMDSWSNVGWDNLNATDLGTVMTALDAVGSVDYLTWTPATESTQKKYRVTENGVNITPKEGAYFDVSFSLDEVK